MRYNLARPLFVLFAAGILASASAQTNKTALTSASTNKPPAIAKPATKGAPATAQAEKERVAEPPGKTFTNSVDMLFLDVGGFWAGKYEVTQGAFEKVTHSNPSSFGGKNRPVDNLSYDDAVEFCRLLTELDIKEKFLPEGYAYTIPTESQWETLVGDASLSDSVTSMGGPRSATADAGSLRPNSLGLYDTRGNVMEFTLADPSKPYRVLRGGSWQDRIEINLRTEFRNYCPPADHKPTYGFRCILVKK